MLSMACITTPSSHKLEQHSNDQIFPLQLGGHRDPRQEDNIDELDRIKSV